MARLDKAFRQTFAVVNTTDGELERVVPDWPRVDMFRWIPLCEQVARHGRPEVIEDHAPLLLLAVPLEADPIGPRRVAVAVLLTEPIDSLDQAASAARVFGVDPQQIVAWANGRRVWPAYAAEALAKSLIEADGAVKQAITTKRHLSEVSAQLLATFEELNLLHRLSEHLSLGRTENELCEQSIAWLSDVVPADCVVAQLFGHNADPANGPADGTLTIVEGLSPVPKAELGEFFRRLGPEAQQRSLVLNRDRTSSPTWCYPGVREVVCSPLRSDDGLIGWVGAINYRPAWGGSESEFGSVEASLLSSVAAILAVHSGNQRLYQERTELFDSAVRALTSAIDAKDPYTCGHSDRVARIAVRIARELGRPQEELSTLYLAGLLHDIGKIGIDDRVLCKPGDLTKEEFEHIKTHPELGERILRDVTQLADVLPIVRHHHEAWDGSGYPDGLAGESSPLLARVTAVADAFDAMGSDRPYRKGIPVDRIEAIFREGAGKQWDRAVIDAYFAAREDILEISHIERDPLDLDVASWNREEQLTV